MAAQIVNTAAAANTGRQREASQSSSGNKKAAGASSDQDPANSANAKPFATDTTMMAKVPSSSSRRDGGSRKAAATPMRRGATAMMPSASDANQTFHTSRNDAVDGPKSCIAPEAPRAAIAVATAVAPNSPSTRRRLSRLKAGPNQRSISHITRRASPALHKPKARALQTFRSERRAAAALEAITANATGTRAPRPSAINVPAAMPEAGQNTATRSAAVKRARPSCAVRK